MLLFHCSGLCTGPPISPSSASDIPSGLNSPGIGVNGTLSQAKGRLLEARMGPGGKGQVEGGRRPPATNHRLRQLYASFEDPSIHFPGHQQFFFRFLVVTDCHRFCRCLEASITADIISLSSLEGDETAVKVHPSSATAKWSGGYVLKQGNVEGHVTVALNKLRILGRFLGLLRFWPQWTSLSVISVRQGPLLLGARYESRTYAMTN